MIPRPKLYYFLAQLYEDYIQLFLQQIIQIPTMSEEESSSIIIQDDIVSIQNIYESFCKHIWKHLVKGIKLVVPCDTHKDSDHNYKNIFSAESHITFATCMKSHLLKTVSTDTYLLSYFGDYP